MSYQASHSRLRQTLSPLTSGSCRRKFIVCRVRPHGLFRESRVVLAYVEGRYQLRARLDTGPTPGCRYPIVENEHRPCEHPLTRILFLLGQDNLGRR